ncbi:MAG: ribokinase [Erysipelotrichaceae bacterium]|nr:ribokinase [Erysipelotrichaceae bacterium]
MKVLNFGSLNYDHVYEVDHFVQPKETLSSLSYSRGFGGKGLNQSIALKKAGLEVYHAGRVGYDGQDFIDYLNSYGVDTTYLVKDHRNASGHARIEVCNAENRIVLYGGTNQMIDEEQIDATLENFGEGDVLLLQNEISGMTHLMTKAHERGMYIAFNTAPMNSKVFTYPLDLVNLFIVNEVEGAGLAGVESDDYDDIVAGLQRQYPETEIVLTVGAAGSYYIHGETVIHQDAYPVKAVDTTAAGDTFSGFFLASYLNDNDIQKALDLASRASSITVQGKGAASSIPSIEWLRENFS